MRASGSNRIKNYGLVIFAGCFTMQALGIGTYVTYGVFFNSLLAEFQCSRVVLSGVSSLALLMMGLVGMLIGRLNDSYGPKMLVSVTSLFFGAGFMLMSQAQAIWQLYLFFGIIFGIGLSSIDVIALNTIARWFSARRGMMTGLIKVGTGAGQFTLPLVASLLIVAVGWRQAFLIIGAVAAMILFGIARILKHDPDEPHHASASGQESSSRTGRQEARSLGFDKARRTGQFWILCVVNFMVVLILMSILVHIVPHARDIGLSPTQAASVLSAIGAVSMVGRFLSGLAIDRWNSKVVMLACFFLLTVGLLWLQVAGSLLTLYLFACVYGLAHGGFFTAISPIAAEVFGIGAHGTLLGVIVCFGTVGGALGPIIAGQLFDMTGSYSMTFIGFIVVSLIGLGVLLLLKPIDERC